MGDSLTANAQQNAEGGTSRRFGLSAKRALVLAAVSICAFFAYSIVNPPEQTYGEACVALEPSGSACMNGDGQLVVQR